jgi:hypothetical protein
MYALSTYPLQAFDNAKRSRIGGVTGSGGITDAECSAVNRKELAAMKKEVVRALKPFLTWNYLHQKNSPNGAWVTARIGESFTRSLPTLY